MRRAEQARLRGAHLACALACALLASGCGGGQRPASLATRHDPGVHLAPPVADATSQLQAVVDIAGVDPAACEYRWLVNGHPIEDHMQAVLEPSGFRKNDVVAVIVTLPSVGTSGVRTLRAETRIVDAPPVVRSAHVALNATTHGYELTGAPDPVDPDGDALQFAYRWFRNGAPIEGGNGPTITIASLAHGDRIAVDVVADDGERKSPPCRSNEVTLDNQPPVFTSSPTAPGANATFFEYHAVATDPDGDPVRYELVEAPAGASITPKGDVLWQVPSSAAPTGPIRIVIRATDSRGGEATQTIDLGPRAQKPNGA